MLAFRQRHGDNDAHHDQDHEHDHGYSDEDQVTCNKRRESTESCNKLVGFISMSMM